MIITAILGIDTFPKLRVLGVIHGKDPVMT